MRKYRIVSEPRGPAYEGLLAFCAEVGAWCSLAERFPRAKPARVFLAKAEQYSIGMDQVSEWPGGGVSKGTIPLWRYGLSHEFVSLLIEATPGLYGWRSPKLPEDLAFHRANGAVLLGSIAHEHMGWMNLSEEEARSRLLGPVELRKNQI